jgi:hypothetical protein
MSRHIAIAALPLLLLGACGAHEDKADHGDATEVAVSTEGDASSDGSVSVSASGAASSVSIKGDGVDINAKLPGLDMSDINADFDIDGVGLYPGSKVTNVNVNATSTDGKEGKGTVKFGFTAPASADTVAAWYAGEFAKAGLKATRTGAKVSGSTKDGDPFTINISPDGTGSKGEIEVSG